MKGCKQIKDLPAATMPDPAIEVRRRIGLILEEGLVSPEIHDWVLRKCDQGKAGEIRFTYYGRESVSIGQKIIA